MSLDYFEAYQHAKDELFKVFRLYQTKLSVARQVPEETPQKKAKQIKCNEYVEEDQGQGTSLLIRSNWNPDAELNHYLNTNHTKHDRTLDGENFDLLEWWKEKERTLHVLAHFAQGVLLVPVSSISSEHAFSEVGRIIEEQRSCLAPDTVEAIFSLKTGLKHIMQGHNTG
uniref:HAT C-terminal dimerisation domain-containing protein n=1 Tax=Oryza glumipatula TaxID=40148 RepID=A0A0D9ZXU3_9ORYZ